MTWLRKQGEEYGMKGGFEEEVGIVELWPDIGGGWGTRRYPRGVWLAPVTPRHRLNGAACPLFWHQTGSSFSFAASGPVTSPPSLPPFVHLLSRAFVLSGLDDSCTVARINCSSRNWSWSLLCSIRGWKISATFALIQSHEKFLLRVARKGRENSINVIIRNVSSIFYLYLRWSKNLNRLSNERKKKKQGFNFYFNHRFNRDRKWKITRCQGSWRCFEFCKNYSR